MQQAERAGRNILCIKMGSLVYESFYIICQRKNWCLEGMLFSHTVLSLIIPTFLFVTLTRGNKSIPDVLPLVGTAALK